MDVSIFKSGQNYHFGGKISKYLLTESQTGQTMSRLNGHDSKMNEILYIV
jgi:hypothetical protein